METLLRLAITAAAIYVGLCVALYLLQERMIFFPRSLAGDPQGPHVQAASIRRGAVTLRGWIVNGNSSGPLLIYFGGNAEELSGLVGTFAKLDAVTVLINYRGYGASDGKPAAADLIEDAAAIVDAMVARFGRLRRDSQAMVAGSGRQGGEGEAIFAGTGQRGDAGERTSAGGTPTSAGTDGRPLVLFGRSLGSGIAALAARSAEVDGLILLSPYRSIANIAADRFPIVPVRWLLRHDIDATLAVDALPPRVLGLYALRDRVVPTAESQALLGLLKTAPQIVEFQGAHGIPLETPAIWTAIAAFLRDVEDASRP